MTRRRSRRWSAALVGTLTLLGAGLLFADATLLTAAVIPLVYVLYGALSRVPEISLAVTRSFGTTTPAPGETVQVSLTVTNDGESVLPDVRIVDRVPPALAVVAGTPRGCVALPPGESRTVTYSVVAKRGEYRFEDPLVRVRSLAATEQITTTEEVTGGTRLTCATAVRDAPIPTVATPKTGTLPTDSGGSGLEFYATREYRRGDPASRIDWRQVAKTGEFVTIQYREERAGRTVVIVDGRGVCRVTPRAGYPTAAELCAYAGERLHDALRGSGVATGVTAIGLEPGQLDGLIGPDGLPWIDPEASGNGSGHPRRVFRGVQDAARTDPERLSVVPPRAPDAGGRRADGGPVEPDADGEGGADDGTISHLLARLPPDAQVVLCSPLLDNWPVELVQTLAVHNYRQVVVSPDIGGDRTAGQRLGSLHRGFRLRTIERAGATVVRWDVDQPVGYALRQSLPHLLGER
ncbi:MAG: DUF58 domain-containing protein [Halovenus sp.]